MYKNILVPIDIDLPSKIVLMTASKFSAIFKSKLIILSCNEKFKSKEEMIMSRVSPNSIGSDNKEIALEAKNKIKSILTNENIPDDNIQVILRDGSPEREILKSSIELEANMIIMGTDGKDSMGDYLYGTISQKVTEKSSCPVLIIPNEGEFNG
mgnify:CR=1 FL=1